MTANLKCRKCGGTDVRSESVKRGRLWAVVLGTSLIVLGVVLLLLGLGGPPTIVTVIPGFSILAFGFRQDPVYIYKCKSCGKTWKRPAKKGPEEGDPRYIEYQTEWQILRLAHDDINHRVQAAKWLGEHRSVSAVPALITRLGDRKSWDSNSRIEAALALKAIGDERAIQPLINAATDTKNELVRAAALSALSAFKNDEIRKILESASNDKDVSIRKAAAQSLAVLNCNQAPPR